MANDDSLTLSIVIPVYNEECHIKNCLDSIANQTIMPDKIIVVDNNSTDRTVEIAKRYPFVKVIHEPVQGIVSARNAGFNATKTDIIGRVDADNIVVKTWVQHVLDLFDDDTVAAVTGPMYFYDMPLQEDNIFAEHMIKKSLYKLDKKFPFLAGNNMAIRSSAWHAVKENTCRARDIHEDIDLAIHLHGNGYKIVYDAGIKSGTSARRFDDPPAKFLKYIKMMTNTFKHHDLNPVGAHIAEVAYSMGYVAFWPLRRSYNSKTGKHSIRQLLQGHKPRKNPMN